MYEGGATSIANFCCQITTEQFDKVQFTQKHVIMLIKTVGYRHCPLIKGLQSRPKRVCIWTPLFHRIQQRCFHLHIVPVNVAAVVALEHSRDYVHLYRTVQMYHWLSCSFNVLMIIAARDRPSATESAFLCRPTHSSCQYAGADCDPTPNQI